MRLKAILPGEPAVEVFSARNKINPFDDRLKLQAKIELPSSSSSKVLYTWDVDDSSLDLAAVAMTPDITRAISRTTKVFLVLPHGALVDAEGRVAASGLVNSREHLESLIEAKQQGVGSIQEYLKKN